MGKFRNNNMCAAYTHSVHVCMYVCMHALMCVSLCVYVCAALFYRAVIRPSSDRKSVFSVFSVPSNPIPNFFILRYSSRTERDLSNSERTLRSSYLHS